MRKRLSTGVYDAVPLEDSHLRQLPPLAVDIIVRGVLPVLAIIAVLLLAFGCGHGGATPTLEHATKGVQLGLGAVRETAAYVEELHHGGTEAAIEHCRSVVPAGATAADREACLAGLGFAPAQIEERAVALLKLQQAYDQIADALELVEEAAPVLQRIIERAQQEGRR